MPKSVSAFNRASKQLEQRFVNVRKILVTAEATCNVDTSTAIELSEEVSSLLTARSELDSLFDKVTLLYDNFADDASQDAKMEEIMNTNTATYETAIFDIQTLVKKLKAKLGTIEKIESDEIRQLEEEKERRIREEAATSKAKRHEELVELQRQQLELQELHNQSEKERLLATRSQIKLHPLKPMEFDGDPKNFASFISNWTATVDKQDLTDETKLRYLQQALGPAPRKTIICLKSGSQYQLAISMLKKKYGNDVTVKKAYYESLENLDDIKNADNIDALRQFSENVEIFCHGLQELGVDINSQDFIFHLVLRKLPEILRLEFSKKVGGLQDLNLETLLTLLNDHVNIAHTVGYTKDLSTKDTIKEEQCFYESSNLRKPFQNRNHRYNRSNSRPTTYHSQTQFGSRNQNSSRSKPNSSCHFCDKPNHWSEDCRKYPTRDARLKKLGSRCLKCLKQNHSTDACFKKPWCPHCRSENVHNRALCPKQFNPQYSNNDDPPQTGSAKPKEQQETSNSTHTFITTGTDNNEYIVFPTAVADVKSSSRSGPTQQCLIAFDTMSSRSYVTTAVARQLGLTKKFHEQLSVHTFASTEPKSISSYRSEISIATIDGKHITIEVSVVNSIDAKVLRAPIESEAIQEQLQCFKLADPRPIRPQVTPVDILIGNDFYDLIVQSERHEVAPGKLWLKDSLLGWIITGRATSTDSEACNLAIDIGNMAFYATHNTRRSDLFESDTPVNGKIDVLSNYSKQCDFSDLWSLDSIGINDNPIVCDDKLALESFEKSIELRNDRYFVRLPWISDKPELPTNSALAWGRLRSMQKQHSQRETWDIVDKIIKDQESEGIIEKVDPNQSEEGLVHYIPHQIVTKEDSATTKVRLVFDASAKTKKANPSLNECLLRGPVTIQDLPGILMRIRFNPILTISDIQAAFLQVGIQEIDRDCTRFFWLKSKLKEPNNENLITYRFTRIPFGIISSPFLLSQTILHHISQSKSSLGHKITENLYVDNVFACFDTVEEAVKFYQVAKAIFQSASMNLRQWSSNNQNFMEHIPESDKAREPKQKVLGLQWDARKDTLSLNVKPSNPAPLLTKANVLKTFSKVFDPNGFFNPFLIRFKLLFQTIWLQQYDWDEPIKDHSLLGEWQKLSEELRVVVTQEIPRYIGSPSDGHTQLLCFTDASSHAYGVAIYIRFLDRGTWTTNIIFSKAKVKPQSSTARPNKSRDSISIPRLELLAILIGVRAISFVEKQIHLPLSQTILWSDSIIALSWINSSKLLKAFVRNRVQEIKEKAPHVDFRYINTKDNPADKLTRGEEAKALIDDRTWWNGPVWLEDSQDSWPTWNFPSFSTETEGAINDEIVVKPLIQFQATDTCESSPYGDGLQATRFSKLIRLLRVSALVEKALKRMRKVDTSSDILPSDISSALTQWIRFAQTQTYAAERQLLQQGKRNKLIKQLNLKLNQDNLIVCAGRLQNAYLPDHSKQPILLPRDNPFTSLVITDVHEDKHLHAGTSQVLCKLRETYWIPKGRSTVKRLLQQCSLCRRHHGGPFKAPDMAPLPPERVSRSPPFSYTGVDYFGPIRVKDEDAVLRKSWICLFTCMATRAIHLEAVEDMSTACFIRAFRRFIARRGSPSVILSDNAKQFKLASDLLRNLEGPDLNEEITTYMTSQNITWKFIPEKSPWFGGFYERLIGIVKSPLRKIIGKSFPCFNELQTIVTEIEALVNSRPLIYVDADINSPITITPKDFLSLNPKTGIPFAPLNIDDSAHLQSTDSSEIQNLWEHGHKALEEFWRLWYEEYLPSLRERYQSQLRTSPGVASSVPQVGTVVLVKEDNVKRGQWKLGRITELIQSNDSENRVALVRMPNGRVIRRAIKLLYPIETCMPDSQFQPNRKPEQLTSTEENPEISQQRPSRSSKSKANEDLLKLFQS